METQSNNIFFGTIKCYYPLRGYGFISRAKGKDVFFHRSAIREESTIVEGMPVCFKIEATKDGPRAIEVLRNG